MDSVTRWSSRCGTTGGAVVEVWREHEEVWQMKVGRRIYILHELSADWSDLFTQGGAEHHDLLLMGSHTKNLLYISAHV